MKKILILAVSSSFATAVISQSTVPATAKVMTTTEARALNGTGEPTINGKPYSQYKAEQEALQRAKEQKKATVPSDLVVVQPGDIKQAQPKVAPTGSGNPENPVVKPNVESAVVKTEEKQATPAVSIFPGQAGVQKADLAADSKVQVTGTSLDPNAKPAAPARNAAAGQEGGAITPKVEANTVKAPTKEAATAVAPVRPAVMQEAPAGNSNSTGGTVEKPAPAPAPKTKSEQAPDAPVQDTKTRQGL